MSDSIRFSSRIIASKSNTNTPPLASTTSQRHGQANLKSAYYKLDNNKLSVTASPAVYKKLLFALCFFHASVQVKISIV